MFALMKMDYHKLRQPAVVYTVLCLVVIMLVAPFFLSSRTPHTVGSNWAGHKFNRRNSPNWRSSSISHGSWIRKTCRHEFGISKRRFDEYDIAGGRAHFALRRIDCHAARPWHIRGHRFDYDGDPVCCRVVLEMARCWIGGRPAPSLFSDHPRSYRMARFMAFLHRNATRKVPDFNE